MKKTSFRLKRRDFLGNITKAGILGALGASSLAGLAASSKEWEIGRRENHSFLTLPYLQLPAADGITIRWLTDYSFSFIAHKGFFVPELK